MSLSMFIHYIIHFLIRIAAHKKPIVKIRTLISMSNSPNFVVVDEGAQFCF